MFSRQSNSKGSNKRERNYRVKKLGIKDENIDRQISVIHQAIAEKLLKQPELLTEVKSRLEARNEEGRIGYGEYITWISLLEQVDDEKLFIKGMLDNSTRMRQLRRRTPFVGILTEEERQAALDKDSLGTLKDASILL